MTDFEELGTVAGPSSHHFVRSVASRANHVKWHPQPKKGGLEAEVGKRYLPRRQGLSSSPVWLPNEGESDAMKALRLLSAAAYAAVDPGGGAGGVPAERRRAAMEYIAFDAHKRYTQVSVETADGERRYEGRIDHVRGALQQFLATCERGSPVAVETVGNWDLDRGRDRGGRPGPAAGPR